MEQRYNVTPEFPAGAYSIDLVVSGNGRRLAIECDGEQYHGPEKLREDLECQAILERLGWTFVRIRGSLFFRDEERALQPVFRRLQELNITPELVTSSASTTEAHAGVVERVIRRAEELRHFQELMSSFRSPHDRNRRNEARMTRITAISMRRNGHLSRVSPKIGCCRQRRVELAAAYSSINTLNPACSK